MGRSSRSSNMDVDGFDHVSHEARAVPVRRRWLHLPCRVDSAHHESPAADVGEAQGCLPLPKAVFAAILAEPGFGPALPLVVGEQYFLEAVEPTERDAAHQRRLPARDRRAVLEIGDEGARHHAADRYQPTADLTRPNVEY